MPKPPSPTLSAIILPEDAAPKIKALLAYWQSIHPAGGGLPGRRHLDPIDIPELLPNIWMIDVKRGPLRFRFRLVGTEIVKFTGRDATGCWLDEIYPGYAESDAFAFHSAVAREGKPGYRKGGVLSNPGRSTIEAERLYLPLAEDGRLVDIVLVMTLYDGEPPPARRR
ncbi:MAG TPA: PAS domain-containing protein, partial [Kiloniellaceae bacterium]